MNTIMNTIVVAIIAIIVMVVSRSVSATIDCYTCAGTIGTAEGDACAAATNGTSHSGFDHCITNYASAAIGDTLEVITRGGGAGVLKYGYCSGSTCLCTSNKCNNDVVNTYSLTCYVCNSATYFDNGCGSKLNTNSKYVYRESRCNACYKQESIDGFARGCLRSQEGYSEGCLTDQQGTTCKCTTDDCNSAQGMHATYLLSVPLIAAVGMLLKR